MVQNFATIAADQVRPPSMARNLRGQLSIAPMFVDIADDSIETLNGGCICWQKCANAPYRIRESVLSGVVPEMSAVSPLALDCRQSPNLARSTKRAKNGSANSRSEHTPPKLRSAHTCRTLLPRDNTFITAVRTNTATLS